MNGQKLGCSCSHTYLKNANYYLRIWKQKLYGLPYFKEINYKCKTQIAYSDGNVD